MKKSLTLLFTLLASIGYSQSKVYDYAYMNKHGMCVYSLTDKKEYLIDKKGSDPCISPDGKKLAYTVNNADDTRRIAIMDLNTKKITNLNTNNNNMCYGPIWSPDGKLIAYNIYDINKNGKWSIAIINADNTNPKILNVEDYYSPIWLNNNIVAQNMSKLKVFDLKGNVIKVFDPKDMEGGINELKGMICNASTDEFTITGDNKKIIFNCGIDLGKTVDEPPSAIFVYDIKSKRTSQLSLKGYNSFGISLKNNKIFFTASKINSIIFNAYSIDIDGKNLKLLAPNCYRISARN